jgi:hypothetical protein
MPWPAATLVPPLRSGGGGPPKAMEGAYDQASDYLHRTRNRDSRIATTMVSSAVATITSAM